MSGEDRSSLWARWLRCGTVDELDDELAAHGVLGDDREEPRAAWRAHRASLERAEARLDARVRDLESLQSLSRSLAEAHSCDEILHRAAEALQTLIDADAVAYASALGATAEVTAYLARPLAADDLTRLHEAVAAGLVPLRSAAATVRDLSAYDRMQGPRRRLEETDIVVVPLQRCGHDVLRIGVVPRLGPSERGLRILLGASSHIGLHLERVMAVAEAEQGRFRAMLDSMPHAVLLTDGSFQIIQANASAEVLLPKVGIDMASAVRSVGDLDIATLAYDVLDGRRAEAAADARLPDGRHLEVAVAAWRDRAGRPAGSILVLHDVTTARRLREQVSQSERLASLGRMVAGVAHELNNPLTAVIGYAQLLAGSPAGDKAAARLATLRKEAERCRRIVQSLLRFARPRGPERRAVSLNEIVENVALLLAYPIRAAGCRIVRELDGTLPPVVGDAHELEQALVNLVTNAQQAMGAAGTRGAIIIRTRTATDGRVVLEVEDEGPGIPEDRRDKVFDPFYTTKPVGQGTGLGLWLVYNAVTAHGGTVHVAEGRARGALVRLEFPTSAAAEAPPTHGEAPLVADLPTVSARILVVDAEAALAALICEALAAEGHVAVPVSDPVEALERLAGAEFDLLVSDAELPGLPGDRLAAEVRRIRPAAVQRILLTTGNWDSREPEAIARRLGAGLLRKPFELDELRRIVRTRLQPPAER